jgi:hypothetical protein
MHCSMARQCYLPRVLRIRGDHIFNYAAHSLTLLRLQHRPRADTACWLGIAARAAPGWRNLALAQITALSTARRSLLSPVSWNSPLRGAGGHHFLESSLFCKVRHAPIILAHFHVHTRVIAPLP